MSNLFRLKVCRAGTALDLLPFPPLQGSSPIQKSCFPSPSTTSLSSSPLFLSVLSATLGSKPLCCRLHSGAWVEFGKDSFKMVFIFWGWKKCHVQEWFGMSFMEYAESSDVFHCLPSASRMVSVLPDIRGGPEFFQLTRAHHTNPYFRSIAGPFVQWAVSCAVIASLCTCLFSFLSALAVLFRYH